jgi:CRISPR-associated helicase Cas3/CRISPR-associated endonuclease Cas3-HD
MREEGEIAGLLHDIGKYAERFQSRLEDNTITGINHWSSGALLAFKLGYPLAAFCIQGHHVGLPNMGDLGSLLRKMSVPNFYEKIMGFQEPHESILNKFKLRGLTLPDEKKYGVRYDFSVALKTRMLFSCLVDADRTDTKSFSDSITGHVNPLSEYPKLQPEKALQILLDEVKKKSSNTTLGKLRNQVLQDCLTFQYTPQTICENGSITQNDNLSRRELPPGIYTLTVPTGGSKTISSIAFGLKHSMKYDKKKLIYVIPFTTIIDQTCNVLTESPNPDTLTLKYNQHFGEDYVLEHHSSLEVDSNHVEKYRIATSNWGNPIVVTTTVQFFESLFSNKTSPCVKLHNIPNSVIIFDEVQNLPTKLLKSLLTAVQVLVKEYGCTVLFCSATVPAFESVNLDTPWKPIEICSDTEGMSTILKRVNIVWKKKKVTHHQLAKRIAKRPQCLTVVNTKFDALEIYNELMKLGVGGCYHLSTNMCPIHRKKVIAEIRERLIQKLPCQVVSTQLIEAGVDVDFPYGYRIFGPLDSVIQTAGRINREGKLVDKDGNPIKGTLEVVGLIDGHSPRGQYQTCISITQSFINQNKDDDVYSPETYRKYYRQMYSLVGKDTDDVFVASNHMQFEESSKQCRIIEDLTVGVIVPYGEGVGYIDLVKRTGEVPKWLYRKLQVVSVNIYRNQLDKMENNDIVGYVDCGDSRVYYWKGEYDENRGIVFHLRGPDDFLL